MIKSGEIRIGNIFCPKGGGTWFAVRDGEDIDDIIRHQSYEPILLSPEVLEKCGFTLVGEAHWKSGSIERLDREYAQHHFAPDEVPNMRIDCILDPYTFSVRRIGLRGFIYPGMAGIAGSPMDLRYLHQLQNFYFDFTGEELQYKP
jgi:hypothetical protein